MDKPIDTMTVRPYGGNYMIDAFLGLVIHTVNQKEYTDQFEYETGIDILKVLHATGIDAMIDEATGYQKSAVSKWHDWVAINLWGLEE